MKIKSILFLLLLSSFGCSSNQSSNGISQLEYNFYSTTLDSLFGNEKSIILRDTVVAPFDENVTGPTIYVDNENLMPKFKVDKKELTNPDRIELIPYSYLSVIEKGEYDSFWDNLFEEYPNSVGYVTLSTVNFNADSTEATFFIKQACGDFCGGEKEIIFKKNNQNWDLAYIMQIGEL